MTATQDKTLPILAYRQAIIEAVRSNETVVVAAETGAGKSTLVPLMLLEAGFGAQGRIGVTEPRRVAAMAVARYVAELHGSELGGVIGYQIGGERVTGRQTSVKFMTEGVLLNELHSDPLLKNYEVVVVDEAHERGVNQDLLLALLKRLRHDRRDLKIVVMSATIDEDRFADFFGGAPVVKVPGRVFPVEIRYPKDDKWRGKPVDVCAAKVREITRSGEAGDILVFLPDEKSIREVGKQLDGNVPGSRILPLYGSQSPEEQREVFTRGKHRRIILSTNVAETSVTIDGVVHVVDSGLIKAVQYVDASMSALQVMDHSQAGCNQRAGRAGRTQAGVCHRVYTKEEFEDRPKYTEPEIKRMSLDQVLLHLRVLGYSVAEIKALEFMDKPGDERWDQAFARLVTLGALDKTGAVTDDGRLMNRLPLAPMLGRMLITASRLGVGAQAATIAAGLTTRSVFVRPKGKEQEASAEHARFKDRLSDGLTILDVWTEWNRYDEREAETWARNNFLSSRALREIDRNRKQILDTLRDEGLAAEETSEPDRELVRKAVCAGLLVNLCVHQFASSYDRGGRSVYIFPGSGIFRKEERLPRLMVCASVVETTKAYARDCTVMDEAWLTELLPEDACERDWFVSTYPKVSVCERLTWQGTKILERPASNIPEAAIKALSLHLAQETIRPFVSDRLNPTTGQNAAVWRSLVLTLGLDWRHAAEQAELEAKLAGWYEKRIAGAKTLDDVRAAKIDLRITDWLTPDLVQKHKERIERERDEAAARESRWEAERAEERAREAERRLKRAQETAPLAARVEDLSRELDRLGGDSDLRGELSWIKGDLGYDFSDLARIAKKLDGVEGSLKALERERTAHIEQTDRIWSEVRSAYVGCPFCGGAWVQDGSSLSCRERERHDRSRIIWLDGDHGHFFDAYLVRFVTDRDEEVARLEADSFVALRFDTPKGHAWHGKKFKTITRTERAAILPIELARQRGQIERDLADLRKMRETVAATRTALEAIKAKHGSIKTLTFRLIDGKAACKVDGILYEASFEVTYPEPGETWHCRIGHELGGGSMGYEVYPEIKATGLPTEKDVSEFEVMLREVYPGLPEVLLR